MQSGVRRICKGAGIHLAPCKGTLEFLKPPRLSLFN